MSIKNLLYNQLRDLRQVELTIIPFLENQAKFADNYPRIGKQLRGLLKESQQRSEHIKAYMLQLKQSGKYYQTASMPAPVNA